MATRGHHSDYDTAATDRCERVLVTLLGDLGPWRERIYLVGGLAPRYLVGALPAGARPHVGTTDVDLVIGVALGDDTPETYRTLHHNLKASGFRQTTPSFAWTRKVDGDTVVVEFLCETDQVDPGDIFRPREETGSKMAAFNVTGAMLARDDYVEVDVHGERIDDGGRSRATVRVANVLPLVVMKIFAFQDRHANKDAYDLVFTLFNADGGPRAAGQRAAASPVAGHEQTAAALGLLGERFADIDLDGPHAYATFLTDTDARARLRQEAVATVRAFLAGFRDTAS
ncbi:hypothetical protein BH23ACT10_BH23ACT10_20760 [soil metagenome]